MFLESCLASFIYIETVLFHKLLNSSLEEVFALPPLTLSCVELREKCKKMQWSSCFKAWM